MPTYTAGYSRRTSGLLVTAALTIATAFAQSSGSIRGTILGDDGKPIPGARVYAAVKSTSQQIKAPPTVATRIGTSVAAAADGTFTIPNLPPGLYMLCAQTTISGWLDACHWAATIPLVNLAAGQNLTGQKVVMTKGAVIQIRINDPKKLLPSAAVGVAHDVEVLALASNKTYCHSRVVSSDATGRNHELTLPFGLAHTLIVRSQQFNLSDSKGNALTSAGQTQPVQPSAVSAALQFNFTVTGKSN